MLVVALAACTGGVDDDATPTEPPQQTTTALAPSPSTTAPAPSPTTAVPTDVTPDVLVAPELLGTADQPRQVETGVGVWAVPEGCNGPPDAVAMLTLTQGTGEYEEPVGIQQVAVFANADAAVAGADALTAALEECARNSGGYALEDVAVGAQGHGFATDYDGSVTDGPLEEAVGDYMVFTRRGSAITLIGTLGGEATVGAARDQATAAARQAWEQLCRYDASGC